MSQPPMPPSAPPPPSEPPPAGGSSENRSLMIVLSYIPILNFIPLIVQQDDAEVRWHAKHGLVLFVAEVILFGMLTILSMIPIVGCVIAIVMMVLALGTFVLHIMCIMKALNGQRFLIPGISEFANKF